MQNQSTDPWTSFLDWLSQIITPNWGDVIGWLPLMLMGLVLLWLLFLAFQWWRAAGINRSRVRRRLPGGEPPPGVHLPGPSKWPFVVPIGGMLILYALAIRPTDPTSGQPAALVNMPVLVVGLLVTAVAMGGWLRDAMREWRRTAGVDDGGERALVAAGAAASAAATAPLHAPGISLRAGGSVAGAPARAEPVAADREPPPGVHLPGPSPWPLLAPIALMVMFFGLVLSPMVLLGGLVMAVIAAVGWLRDAGWEYRQVEEGHAPEPKTRDPERALPKALLGVYAMIAALSLALAAAPGIVAFANASPPPAGNAAGGGEGGGGAAGDQIAISAQQIAFNVKEIKIPADKPFRITFENKEAAPHNVAIFADEQLSKPLFTGEIITGPKTITYDVNPIPAGKHFFVCTVHPNMKGTATAQ